MIELRGLHMGNIARSPDESVRPDLWPDHAWVPALGCTGGVLYDLCRGMMAVSPSIPKWGIGTVRASATNEYLSLPINLSERIVSANRATFVATVVGQPPEVESGLFSRWGTSTALKSMVILLDSQGRWVFASVNINSIYSVLTSTQPMVSGETIAIEYVSGGTSSLFRGGHVDQKINDTQYMGNGSITYSPFRLLGKEDSLDHYFRQSLAVFSVYLDTLLGSQGHLDIAADPLLPFRRRQPVYYSVPSGGGNIETPAAMMMAL